MSSMFNKTKAVSCPQSWDEYLEAASKLCPQIDGEYNYICVPNQNKTELVQFCFGSGRFPAWQLAEHCPYLHNTGNMNAENCTRFLYGCPEKHYMTKEIYKYQACLDINPERGCYVADSNCSKSLTSTVTPASTSPAAGNEVTIALSVVFGVIFCVLISVLISFIYMKKRGKYRKKKHKDINCPPAKKYKRTENENVKLLGNSAENERETNNEPNMSLHEGGYISEKTSAKMMHFKDEINTKTRAFYSACKNGNTDLCRYLLDRDPHILNQVDDDGWNAASCAAQGGNVEILELLAQKGVDITLKTNVGGNILHIACINSRLEMCQYIIQHYPDMLNQVDNNGWNAASCAAQGGNVEILELLAQKGVDITLKTNVGGNILHIACINSRLEMCQYIIQHYPDMLNQVDNNGCNAALCAVQGGNVEILELLAQKGVDIALKTNVGGNILHIACINSRLEMCQYIIQHYPDMLNQVDNNGWNAALCAVQGGNAEILELLAQKGVDITLKTNAGGNILHIACVNCRLEMCQYIIQHYPDMLNQVGYNGCNAASCAAQGGNVEILELLAQKGVDITLKTNAGGNILHIACVNCRLEMCQYIIQHYPDMLNQVDNNGWNAALCAVQGGNAEILELLAQKGVDITLKTNAGGNILHIACVNCRLEMCQYIIQHYPDMLNQVDNNGCNAALCAVQGGNVEILELLAQKGVDITLKTNVGGNILHIACINSRLEMCQYIIQHYPDMLNQVDNNGWNAALCAVQGGNAEILELLAQKGVDITLKTNAGGNILHIACINSRLEMCQYIIQHYPDMLNQVDNDGCNAASCAAQGGNVEILELLAQKGVDITLKINVGGNILQIACINSRLEMCQYIIQHYPDMLNQVDNNGWNAALCAVQGGNAEILELLAQKGVDMTFKTKKGSNILHIACINSKSEMCQYIIQHYPDMLNQVNNDGWYVALYVAQGGNVEILELLAQKGVDITLKNNVGGNILHIACVNSRLEMCQYIIQHYPDMLNQVNNNGSNVALCAVQGGNVEILELLAQKGVDITLKNKAGQNILHIACVNCRLEMCQYIIQHYPDMLNQVDNNGWNVALYAAQGGNVEILELLAQKGVDITLKTNVGGNILHIACATCRLEMCQYIIQHYPDMLNQVDNIGWNAALHAAQGGNAEILELLAQKGVDMTFKTKKGSNILHIACINSKSEMCQYIIQHYPDMLNQVNNDGWNAALCAAQGGNVGILELLAEKGVQLA